MRVRFHNVHGPIGRFMRRMGWAGVTIPHPFGITVLFWGDETEAELLHEMEHARQIERMGRLRFALAYVWELVRSGYRKNRFEVEARRSAGEEI